MPPTPNTPPKVSFQLVTDLIPSPTNARTHSPEQIKQIVASIERFGFTNPILADGLNIIAGHGRCSALCDIYARSGAIRLPSGAPVPPGKVPVIDVSGWSDDDRRAYMLADNQLALNAGWDEELLATELGALTAANFDMSLLGFEMTEIDRLLGKRDGATDPDDVPPVPEAPVSLLGDIWLLGDHRIICGSSTDPDDVAAVLAGAKPHLMVTDPPYGVEYDATFRNGIKRANGTIVGARAVGKVLNDDRADWSEAWALFAGDVAYVWHAGIFAPTVADSLTSTGFELRSQIIWAKQQFAIGRCDYHWQHEPCWYAVRKGKTGHYEGDRKQSTLWEIPKPAKSETGHSTQKPIECMKRPIENNSVAGDLVYEPFSGSGTTIIAGQMTGRKVIAIELNPAYVDVAATRWQDFTGLEAVLESTGQTFAQVKAERAA